MSFTNPLEPSFQVRRLEIQKSIMNLQQRLLRRKQLDLQIEKQLLQQQQNSNKAKKYQSAYHHIADHSYGIQKQLDQRLGYLQDYDPRAGLIKALQQQKVQTDYLARLRQLEIQQNIIGRQYLRKRQDVLYYNNKPKRYINEPMYPLDVSGEVLAKKYVDGTRALELNEELKKSSDNLRRIITDKNVVVNKKQLINQDRHRLLSYKKQPDHSTVKKYVVSSKKGNNQSDHDNNNNKYHNTFNSVDPTPIKMIENSSSGFNSTAGNFYNHNENQNKNLTKIQEQESLHQSPILLSKGLKKSRSKSTQPTNQYIVASYLEPKSFSSTQRPKSSQKNSRYLSNRQKSSKSLKYASGTKQALVENYQPMQRKIRREVQDRLRMSQQSQQILDIFYAKDITEYLMTIYGKEDKFRKQLKQKVCKTPGVQRKFDVCPVLQ